MIAVGQIVCATSRRKTGVLARHVETVMPTGHALMNRFPARFQRVIRELGLRHVVEIALRMLVSGITELELECFNGGNRFPDLRSDVVAGQAGRQNAMRASHLIGVKIRLCG